MPFVEYIESNALDGLDLSDVKLLYNHEYENILARTDSSTLKLKVDKTGLFFVAQIPNTTLGRDTFENIQNGNLKGCSFGFDVDDDEWSMSEDGVPIHVIKHLKVIREISITALPAYEETSVEVQRSLNKLKKGGQDMPDEEKNKKQIDEQPEEEPLVETDKQDAPKDSKSKEVTTKEADKKLSSDDEATSDASNISEIKEMMQKILDGQNEKVEQRDDEESDEEIRTKNQEDSKNEDKKQGGQDMPIDVTKNKEKDDQVRGLEAYIRSHGEKRDGVTSGDVGAVIPEQIIYNPEAEVKSVTDLSKEVQHTKVSTASGVYPILKRATTGMHTVEELEENPALAKPEFTKVKWEVKTYRGAIPISEESIADAQANLMGIIQQNAREQRVNTLNQAISDKLKMFQPAVVDTKNAIDDIKEIMNVSLDPAYDKKVIITQSAFQKLDTLKDGEGRYLLQDSITETSQKRLMGLPVVVIEDELMGAQGEAHMWIGDLNRAILFADRLDTQIEWVKNEIYGRYLALVMRLDVEIADENAGYFISVDGVAPTTTTTTTKAPK